MLTQILFFHDIIPLDIFRFFSKHFFKYYCLRFFIHDIFQSNIGLLSFPRHYLTKFGLFHIFLYIYIYISWFWFSRASLPSSGSSNALWVSSSVPLCYVSITSAVSGHLGC